MTKRYTGGVVSSAVPTANSAGASGVFLLSQQADYQAKNNWPPFKVEKSLRFRASAGGAFTKVVASSSAGTKGTLSVWVKKGKDWDSNNNGDLVAAIDGYNYGQFFQYGLYFGNTTNWMNTAAVYRDPSAWYHVFFVFDTTLATSTDRLQIWVNGVRQTAGATVSYPTQNASFPFLTGAQTYYIGGRPNNSDNYFDGYMSEYNFVDGQALTPSSFGAYDKDGNWSPIAYTGTYGQNGFYLNFKDATSTTALGYDYSGNGNNWTPIGFNVATANTSYDSMIDVPSDQSGANTRGNYCTINPLMQRVSELPGATPSNGNLTTTHTPPAYGSYVYGSMAVSSGKWYYEMTATTVVGTSLVGLDTGQTQFNDTGGLIVYFSNGNKRVGASYVSYGATWTSGDVIGVAYDLDGGTVTFYKNGTSQGVAATGVSGTYMPHAQGEGGGTYNWNFGQRPFAYTPPDGYKTLNTYNLPEPTIKQPNKHFDINLWTGTGATQSITNSGQFQPDFVWIKGRSNATYHMLTNSVTGSTRYLYSNDTLVEGTWTDQLTSFNSNGFTLGADTNGTTNYSGRTFVGWQWNAGGANTTNTSGSVTSIVRANPTAGFSIVSFTKSSASVTVGHGLSTAPCMIILADRTGAGQPKTVYHKSLGENWALYLNATGQGSGPSSPTFWNNTAPTSSVFSVGSYMTTGNPHMAYCWSEIDGYSKFGSYTGNGSTDGPFVFTGFRPKFVMIKSSSSGTTSYNWALVDSTRSYANKANHTLAANLSDASSSFGTGVDVFGSANIIDILSNGFKIRDTGVWGNNSGTNYIFMAFAEMPFKYSRAR